MAFDFKKEYKELYIPKHKPGIVTVPPINCITVRGKGDPSEKGGAYQQTLGILYAVTYTLKMSYKTSYKVEGFLEYVVPPLERFWWQNNVEGVDHSNKSSFQWISTIRLPDFVTKENLDWVRKTAEKRKELECSSAEFLTIGEGLYIQMMHLGAFDNEPTPVAVMDKFVQEKGYIDDMSSKRLRHEIYMTDARRTAPEKWKTIIRYPTR